MSDSIPMVLVCPKCKREHVDPIGSYCPDREYHSCHWCDHLWAPVRGQKTFGVAADYFRDRTRDEEMAIAKEKTDEVFELYRFEHEERLRRGGVVLRLCHALERIADTSRDLYTEKIAREALDDPENGLWGAS